MPMEQSYTVQGIAFLSPPLIFFGNFDLFCPSVETIYIYINIYIYGWRSEFPVSRVVWTKKSWNWKVDFTFWLWSWPQLNDALHNLGAIASVALVKLWYAERCAINMQRVVLKTFSKIFHCGCFAAIFVFNMGRNFALEPRFALAEI